MPRIVGVDLPPNKRIDISLGYLYGIGSSNSLQLLRETGIDPKKRAKELTDEEVSKLTHAIQQGSYKVEGDLRREVSSNIRRLIEIGSYRGLRHKRGLPVRGQRTKTNARTRKGPRPRVGVRKRARPTGPGAAKPPAR
jgi:small subunit ribosomal protein S13